MTTQYMCPSCGMKYTPEGESYRLVPKHNLLTAQGERIKSAGECPGSEQCPRNAESDKRPLWSEENTDGAR